MCQKSTAHEQCRSRGGSRKLRFGLNRTAPKIWQEGQHDLHSPPQPIDWRTHHWSSPRSKLAYKKPTSTRKLRKFPVTSGQGSKHRDWTASRWWARWRSQSSSCQHIMSSLDASWFRLITNILIQSRDPAIIARWHKCGTMTSQMLARASFPPSVWPSSRSNFDLGQSPLDSTEKTLSYQSLWFWSAVFL